MKVTFVNGTLDRRHLEAIKDEDVPQPLYPIDWGMADIIKDALLEFDFFDYLKRLYDRSGTQLYVIEGGCGIGNALVDLKRGVSIVVREDEPSHSHQHRWKLQSLSGRHFQGLEDKIHTTGATLTRRHADTASSVEEPYQIDEMIVGPIEQYPFERKYDFALDFKGAAFHFPQQVIPVYGRILKDGSPAFIRLHTGEQYTGENLEFGDFSRLFYQSGLEVVGHSNPKLPILDFLVESDKMIVAR
ncbi:MAG: hypothetical protein AABX34_04845 [Nanoarchaeota archaeon]